MREIYVLLHDGKKLFSRALAAITNLLTEHRKRNSNTLYPIALYIESKPEFSKPNLLQMQMFTHSKNRLKSFKGWMLIAVMAFMAVMISAPAGAQNLGNYAFSFSQTGSLDAMTGATSLAGTGALTTGYNDDNASAVTTMPGGFSFVFMGQPYTQFSVNSNGQMRLGASVVANNASFAASNALMAPFAGDNSTGLAGDADPISYLLTGTAPNRILKIQWKNFNLPFSSSAPAGANMQVWLYEGSGRIDYVYGAMSANAATSRSIFLSSGATATTAGYITIGGTPTFTLASTAVTNTIASGNIANLYSAANGARWVYTFTPPTAVPAAPITLGFNTITSSATTVTWVDNSTSEGGFLLTRATDAGFTQNVVATAVASTTTAGTGTAYSSVQSGLTAGITYYYKVVAATEAQLSAELSGSQATTAAATYYYVGGASSDIATAASWNTAADGSGTTRLSAQTTDILIVDGQGNTPASGTAVTLSMAAATSIGALQITNNTAVTLQSTSTTTRALTITGSVGDELSVGAGSSLILNNATQSATIAFSTGTGMTGTIAGTLTFAGSTSNTLTTTGGTGTVVTVTGTGVINLAAAGNTLVGSAATLIISNGATVNSSGATTGAPPVPLATWGATSNLVVTGITTSTTAPTNNVQSFGNITYNCPSASATMSWFTSSTTAAIKGNLTIQATGTGKFRVLTSGALTISGDLVVSGGNCEVASSTGVLTVAGNVSQTGGRLEITSGTSAATLKVAGTFNQTAGDLLVSGSTTSNTNSLEFNGTTAQNVTFNSTVSGPVNVRINNAAGINLSGTLPINVGGALTVSAGNVTGSGSIVYKATNTYTSAAGATSSSTTITVASTAGLVPGMTVTVTAGTGTFAANTTVSSITNGTTFVVSTAPTVILSGGATVISGTITGNNRLVYNGTAAQTANATEFPATNGPNSLTINNTGTAPANTVTVGFARTLGSTAGVLTLTAGILDNGANLLTIGNTATGGISGGSATAYVKGVLARTLPASLVTGSTYTFPVGKTGYNPFELVNPTTGSGGTVVAQAEVLDGNSGGTPGSLMGSISTTRYWAASIIAGSANFTNTFIKLNDTRGTQDGIASSATQTGAYNHIGGVASTLAAGAITTTAPAVTALNGFYLMGNLGAASVSNLTISPSGTQCANVARNITALVTPGGATVSTVVINYSINGVAQTAVSMTNQTNNGGSIPDTWAGTIPTVTPPDASVTWSVTATDANSLTASATGTAYTDEPLFSAVATATVSNATVCAGAATSLSATIKGIGAGTVAVGTATTLSGATDVNTAFNNRWPSARFQLLYTAAELQTAGLKPGNITSIAFNINSLGDAATNANYRVKIGNTALSALTAFVDTTTGFTNVYNPKTYTHTSSGLQTIPFDAPFNWDGTSNIIVQVVMSGADISNNSLTYYTATTTNQAAYTATVSTDGATLSLNRLNIVFGGQTLTNLPITSLVWSNGAGTGNPQTVNPTSTTSYTATITALGCTKTTNAITVNVNPLPTAPAAGTASTQCGTGIPTVAVSDPNGFTTPTYKWYADNVTATALQTGTSTTYTSSISTTTNFYVSVTNPTTGCESPRTMVTANVTIPDPITATTTNASICQNASVTLGYTQTGSTNVYNQFAWVASPAGTAGIASAAAASTSALPTAAGNYTYTLTATETATGCVVISQVGVTVNPNPVVGTVTASPSPVCSNSTVSLTATSVGVITGTAAIGAGATTSSSSGVSMFSGSYGGIKTQYIIKASELTAANVSPGAITSLGFVTSGAAGQQYTGFAVSIGHTTQTSMAIPLIGTGLTQVYAGTEGANNGFTPATSAVNTLVFGTGGTASSFVWNGTDNIVISFCFSTVTGATTSSATTILADAPGFTCSAYGKKDAVLPSVLCPMLTSADFGTSSTATSRPRFIIGGQIIGNTASSFTWTWTTTLSGGTIANGAVTSHVPVTTVLETGTYTATATSAAGCTASLSSASQTVNPLPAAPGAGTFPSVQCGVGIPNAFVTGASSGQYRWYTTATGGTALSGETNASLTAYVINTTTNLWVSVNNGTCEGPRTAVQAVVVAADPITAKANTVAGTASTCLNTAVNLSVDQVLNNPNTYEYTWTCTSANVATSGLTSAVVTSTGNTTVTPTAAGTYTYQVVAFDAALGCTNTSNVTVTVNSLPSINQATATPAAICPGGSVTLTGTTTVVSSGNGSSIGTGTSLTSATTQPTAFNNRWGSYRMQLLYTAAELTAAGVHAGNITSMAFNINSLGDAATNANFRVKIGNTALTAFTAFVDTTTGFTNVFNPKTYTHTASGLQTITFDAPFVWNGTSNIVIQVCMLGANSTNNSQTYYTTTTNNTVAYTSTSETNSASLSTSRMNVVLGYFSSVTGAGSLTWTWDNGAGTGNSVTVTPTETTTYTVTADNGVCTSSSPVTVTVYPAQAAPTATDDFQCGTIVPTAFVTSASTTPSFNWYTAETGGTPVQTGTTGVVGQNGYYNSPISANTTFYVTEVSANGCESTPRTAVNVFVITPDPITVSASITSVCEGSPTDISFSYTPTFNTFATDSITAVPLAGSGITPAAAGTNYAEILFNGTDGSIPFTVTPTVPGTYVYTIKAQDGPCVSLNTVSVTVKANPTITSFTALPSPVCEGASVSLTAKTVIVTNSGSAAVGTATTVSGDIDGFTAFNNRWPSARYQLLYTAAELSSAGLQAGNITAIAFNTATLGDGATNGNFRVKIGNTSLSALTAFVDTTTGFTNVFNPKTYTHTASGLQTITFDAPFNWNGTSNIIVQVAMLGADLTNNAQTYYTATATNQAAYTSTSITSSATLSLNRLNIIFTGVAGTNLTGNSTWVFNPGAIDGGTTGTATTIANTGVSSYTVTATQNGCSTTSSPVSITVNPLPAAPAVTNSVQCGIGIPTASVSGAGGTYKWYDAATGGTLLQTGGATYSGSISTATHFYVSETSAAGCEGPRADVFADVTAPPALVITPAGTTTFCAGGSVNLTASGTGYTNFTWSPATGLNTTSGATVTANPSVTQTYTVAANDGVPVTGCSNTATITITVNPNPVITSTTASVATVCGGGSSVLTAKSLGGSGNITVGTESTTSTTGGPYRSGFGSDNKVQYLFTASELLAAGILPGNITSVAFNVTSLGSGTMANFKIAMAATTASTITTDFDASTLTNVYGPLSYTAVTGLNTHAFTTPFVWDGASNVIVQVCHDAQSSSSSTVSFTADNDKTTYLLATGACGTASGGTLNSTRALIKFGFTQDNTVNYNWTWNPGAIAGSTVTVNPSSTTSYTVTAANPVTGCTTSSSTPVTVTVQAVNANAVATPAAICIGGSTTIAANATGGAPFTYLWSPGGATTATITVSPTTTTVYSVTVTDACGNPVTSQVTVTVNPLPTIAINEPTATICLPATYPLTTTTSAASPAYQWINGSTDIAGQTGAAYTATVSGTYKVKVTDGVTGCINTSATINLTVNPQPVAVVVTPSSATVCSGGSVSLTASGGTTGSAGTVTLGTGTSSTTAATTGSGLGPNPFQSFYGGTKQQMLVLASELSALGITAGTPLNSIAFTLNAVESRTLQNYVVKMQHTSLAAFTNTTFVASGFTVVRTAANYTPVNGLNTIPFTTNFVWNGTSNLLVEINFSNNDGGGSGTNTALYSTTSFVSSLFYRVDNSTAAVVDAVTAATASYSSRNNIVFGYNSLQQPTYSWLSDPTLSTTTGATTVATPINTTTYTAVATNSFGCTRQQTVTVTANACSPVWTGATSTNWNTASNWSSNVVPSIIENVTIGTAATGFYPVLTGNVTVGGTLTMATGTSITIGSNTLTLNGGVTPISAGVLVGSATSNLSVAGTAPLKFATGAGGTLKNLTVTSGTATLTSALDITGGTGGVNSGTFGTVTVANGATLASAGFLTFKSNASGTARLASGNVTGDVTVERYIPANAKRAYRMLSVPTKGGQKIKAAWQEGGTNANFNPKPGFGTVITSNVGPSATMIANGFDQYSTSTSIQRWNTATGAWVDITATQGTGTTGNIESLKGYSIYIRGDRTQLNTGTTTTATTLRTTGTLYIGDQAPISIPANKFEMVGNNYVSAIDFALLGRSNVNGTLYLWDPKLPQSNGTLGGYVSFVAINGYTPSLTTGSYTSANSVIESGQSFFVATGANPGTLTITESAKVASSRSDVFRPATAPQKLKANLYVVATDNSTVMADANVSVFDSPYSNAVDGDDGLKLSNAGENLAIYRENKNLVVEGRQPVADFDTTYFNMWNMSASRQYRLELVTEQMNVPGLSAYLVDNYLGTTTPLNMSGSISYDFGISSSAPLSGASNRFKVVYKQVQLAPLPVTFVNISANKLGAAVKVDWKVAAERGIVRYEVERSADGSAFTKTGIVTATGNSSVDLSYSWMDATPLSGTNFYRIKSVGVAGDVKYTNIVKVSFGEVKPAYTIAPNPVEGSTVNLQFKNRTAGRYNVRLLSNAGQVIFTTIAEHAGGNSTQLISLPATIARGAYQIEIIAPDKTSEVQNLFINTTK